MLTDDFEDLRLTCREQKIKGKLDASMINAIFNEGFFTQYNSETKERGYLKIKVYNELIRRYDYPNSIDVEDVLFLIKEQAEE